jgi:Sel1 repeat
MPTTERRAENLSLILADCTISGDRGMLVLQAAEPDKSPVSPREGIRYVTLRLCAIVGVAMLIAAGLLWFPGMRQSANFALQDKTLAQVTTSGGKVEVPPTKVESPVAENDLAATIGKPVASPSPSAAEAAATGGPPLPMQVANSSGKVEVPPTKVESPVAENDLAATIGKPVASPSPSASEAAPTGGPPLPMQVANSGGKVEAPPTKVESPVAENGLAATIGKPAATAPSLPVAEVGSIGGTPKPTSQSALAPVASGPVPGPALATTGAAQLDNNEIAMLVRRGKDFLKEGDLASARLLFQRAAAAGNAVAPAGGTPKPTSVLALAPVASSPVSGPAPASGGTTQPDNNEIAMFVRRGKDFLKDGDLVSARLLFQRAAAAGNAEASFILGTTFDPRFIRRMGVVGMESDIARAREWYKRAAELGSAEASQQLATDGTRE